MEATLNNNLQPTSVSVLMINAQGMMLSVLGQDYFVSYNRVPWLRCPRQQCAQRAHGRTERHRMAGVGRRPRNRESQTSRTLSAGDEAVAAGCGLKEETP